MEKIALVFDVDETITKKDTIFELFRLFGKKEEAEQIYEWSKNDPKKIAEKYGIDEAKISPGFDCEYILNEILKENGPIPIERFIEAVDNCGFYAGAEDFFNYFSNNALFEIYFLTSMYSPSAKYIASKFKVKLENVIATELREGRNQVTGFIGPVIESQRKEKMLNERILTKKYAQVFGFGDSGSDYFFLKKIRDLGGTAIAVKQNKKLMEICQISMKETNFGRLKKIILENIK